MQIGEVTCTELARDNVSPVFSFRRDNLSCRRHYTCNWENVADLVVALRGSTGASSSIFNRTPPHQFWFQTLNRQMTCVEVAEVKGAGVPRNDNGSIITGGGLATSSTLIYDENYVGVADKAHVIADYSAVNYALLSDDDIDDPVTPTGAFTRNEWDRYTEWTVDFNSQLINLPAGAYKYQTGGAIGQPANQQIRVPISEARITAKVYNLPFAPIASYYYNGAVNLYTFEFYLRPVDGAFGTEKFSAEPETLLFLYAKSDVRNAPNGDRYYDLTYHFSYRALDAADGNSYGHNAAPYYNPSTKRVTFERIAADTSSTANAKADNSAPFRLRNFGYLWSPATPTLF